MEQDYIIVEGNINDFSIKKNDDGTLSVLDKNGEVVTALSHKEGFAESEVSEVSAFFESSKIIFTGDKKYEDLVRQKARYVADGVEKYPSLKDLNAVEGIVIIEDAVSLANLQEVSVNQSRIIYTGQAAMVTGEKPFNMITNGQRGLVFEIEPNGESFVGLQRTINFPIADRGSTIYSVSARLMTGVSDVTGLNVLRVPPEDVMFNIRRFNNDGQITVSTSIVENIVLKPNLQVSGYSDRLDAGVMLGYNADKEALARIVKPFKDGTTLFAQAEIDLNTPKDNMYTLGFSTDLAGKALDSIKPNGFNR